MGDCLCWTCTRRRSELTANSGSASLVGSTTVDRAGRAGPSNDKPTRVNDAETVDLSSAAVHLMQHSQRHRGCWKVN